MAASYAQFTRPLGKNGPQVTALGFGLMGLSSAYVQKPKPDEERMKFLDHVYESGERMWDSSNSYGDSELLLGKWFQKTGKRNDIFLATKFGFRPNPDGTRYVDNSAEHIKEACNKSLERLQTDHIDLYYCHRLNGKVPVENVVNAMADLKREGKIRHIGLSEVSADTLRRACSAQRVDAVQLEYSPFAMDIEALGLLHAAREYGVAVVAYSPLGRGFLAGRFRSPDDLEDGDIRKMAPRYSKENFGKNLELVDLLSKIADTKGCTASQLVLAWLMQQGEDIIPIPGTTNEKRHDENMAALRIKISDDEDKKIREATKATEVVGARYPPAMVQYCFADTPTLA